MEYQGDVAQIDHLLISRFLEIYICESRRFGEGIAINEHGEFAAFYQGKPYGIPSPIEQNNRHQILMKRMFDAGEIETPSRAGLRIKPSYHSLILVSNSARIQRPKNGSGVEHLDRIIKNEHVHKKINKDTNEVSVSGLLGITKVIAPETLQTFAESLAALHQPLSRNWKARFGITDTAPPQPTTAPQPPKQPQTEAKPHTEYSAHLFCAGCKKAVTQNVAQFCWKNKARFQGKVYCYNCQRKH